MKLALELIHLEGLREHPTPLPPLHTTDHCPICHSEKIQTVAILNESVETALCPNCHHLFHNRKPDKNWFQNWYRQNWDKESSPNTPPTNSRRYARALKKWVRQRLSIYHRRDVFDFCKVVLEPGNKVLDIGCGNGHDLQPFIGFGCQAYGIELSKHRATFSRQQGICVKHTDVEDLNIETFGTAFDLISSNHVLEHVYDPHTFIKQVVSIINPDGYLCLSVPNLLNTFLLNQFFYILHIHCFSKPSLIHLLEQHGFTIKRVTEDHQIRILAQYTPHARTNHKGIFQEGISQDLILEQSVGAAYDKNKVDTFCYWWRSPSNKKLDRHSIVHFTEKKPDLSILPRRTCLLKLDWDQNPQLPLHIYSHDKQAIPFWVK